MARPIKTGLDYFATDVNIDNDDKIYMLEAELGELAFGRYIKLLAEIYKDKGYYKKWDDQSRLVFSGKKHIPAVEIDALVDCCIRHDIFDADMYSRHKILTSTGIQKRYFEAVRKRGKVHIEEDYLLIELDPIFSEKTRVTAEKTPENSAESTQSKVKESKEKESNDDDVIPEITQEEKEPAHSRVETARYAWNSGAKEAGSPEYRNMPTNMPPPDREKILSGLSTHTDHEIIQAVSNYFRIKNGDDFDAFPNGYRFPGFMATGIDQYLDTAKPFDRCKRKDKTADRSVIQDDRYIPPEVSEEELEAAGTLLSDLVASKRFISQRAG